MMLARFAVWSLLRERSRDPGHGVSERTCVCETCCWGRGIEAEADTAFGLEWRP